MGCKCNRETRFNNEKEEFCMGCALLIDACKCKSIGEKISIVIPVYNAEDYINEAIKNVLRQTYDNYEVIVVDDGSTDHTLVNMLRDPRAKDIKIVEKKNGGVSSALNAGIKEMTGEWFKWLSADDLLSVHCLETMMNYIKKQSIPENKIYYTNYNIINQTGELIEIFNEPNRNHLSYIEQCAHLYNNYYGNATTCMIHKSIFETVGLFDETLKNGDDYDFWLRSVFGWKTMLHLIPENLASYRRHDKQLTNRRGAELFKTVQQIRKKNLQLLDKRLIDLVVKSAKQIDRQPIKVRLRRKIRDITFGIMPSSFNNKLLAKYQGKKN